MGVEIIEAGPEDKAAIAAMMPTYLIELASFAGEVAAEESPPSYRYLDAYWTEAERHPFLILQDGETAGFCLVRELGAGHHQMAEFYIVASHRRVGAGRQAARTVFALFPGQWEVAQEAHNKVAQQFWRRVIGEVSDGRFEESWSDSQPSGPMQRFLMPAG